MKVFDGLHAFMWESMIANNCNTYLIDGPTRVLIDPGHEAYFDHVTEGLAALGLGIEDIDMIICTHCHPDHIEAVNRFNRDRTQFAIHEAEWGFLTGPAGRRWNSLTCESTSSPLLLREGPLTLNNLSLEVYHTPGHSPGSLCL